MKSVHRVIEKYGRREAGLIPMLQDLQKEKGYLPEEDLAVVATEVKVPLSRLFSLATFYKAFSLVPRGRHMINVCLGTACHVRGSKPLLNQATSQLGVQPGETTEDGLFTIEKVNCLGACALGPIVTENGDYHHHMSPGKLRKLIKSLRGTRTEETSHE